MKIFVNIVLFLFLAFLATPTIVSLIQDDADMSMVYSMTEEEIQKEIKEIKAAPSYMELRLAFFLPSKKNSIIKTANDEKHDNVSRDIHSPPPDLI
ncbi:MAG: hypothetical protein DI539_08840 [Flavobacterium psychrophilum]|nr:MAG: hypothetical protein DI539_08840 [Flavobacterium psychrophilum]